MSSAASISVVVLAIGPDRLARRAVSAAASIDPSAEVIVVHDFATANDAEARFGELTRRRAVRWINVTGSEGEIKNAGLAAAQAPFVALLDGSESVSADLVSALLGELDRHPEAAVALAAAPDHSAPAVEEPIAAVDAASSAHRFAAVRLWRRDALAGIGGFDSHLPALTDWDALLSVLERGGSARIVPIVVSRNADDVRRRELFREERYLPAVRRIFEKHRATFAAAMPGLLGERDGLAKQLWRRERGLIATRDTMRDELNRLTLELAGLREQLRPFGRATLEWNDLRRTTPLSRNWGLDRGDAVDRVYIEEFLNAHRLDIQGDVLEVLDSSLTTAYGSDRVTRSDVLDIDPGNARATVIADLRSARQIPSDHYDCFILTQTLHLIDDMAAVVAEAHRMLKPGGVLLVTMPTASMVATEYGDHGDHWRVTEAGARHLFSAHFDAADVTVRSRGNVLVTTAFLYGLSRDELRTEEFGFDDPAYPTLITIRAVKRRHAPAIVERRAPEAAILLYHRIADAAHDAYHLSVRPDDFVTQLEHLRRDWQPMTLAALAAAVAAGAPPERGIAVTFDDGYLDNLDVAASMLAQAAVPATFFLTSETPEIAREYWWDRLERAFLSEPQPSAEARRRHDEWYARLKASLPATREYLLRQLPAVPSRDPHGRPMVAAEIARAAALPHIEIGAHSVHHTALTDVDREMLFHEVFDSRADLERLICRPVTLFAYPFGQLSADVVGAVAAADYRAAVTCEPRGLRAFEHPLRLPRLQAPSVGREFGTWLQQNVSAAPAESRRREG